MGTSLTTGVIYYAIEATFRVAMNNSTTAAIIIDFGSRLEVP